MNGGNKAGRYPGDRGCSVLTAVVALAAIGCATPPVVEVEQAGLRDLAVTVTMDCAVQGARRLRVTAGVAGVVDRIAVVEGQQVGVGDVLVRLDEARAVAAVRVQAAAVAAAVAGVERARLDVEAARGRLARARAVAERQEALWSARGVSRADFRAAVAEAKVARGEVRWRQAAAAEAESLLRAAEADAQRARSARRETTIRAPFDGVVSRVHAIAGQQVQGPNGRYRGSALLDIEGGELSVDASVMAVEASRIAAGQQATVRVHAYPGRSFTARVEAVGLESSEFGVRVVMSPVGSWAGVSSGFGCEVDVTTAAVRAAVAVPRRALLMRDERLGVWRVADGRVSFAPLSVGMQGDVFVEVLAGVTAGDRVVVGPYDVAREIVPGQRMQATGR